LRVAPYIYRASPAHIMKSVMKFLSFVVAVAGSTPAATDASVTVSTKPDVVKFGPDDCISTHKDAGTETCIIETDCKNKALTGYNPGVTCLGKNGERTRHVFGVNSFLPAETFDTDIKCDECLALDEEISDDPLDHLAGKVASLKEDMHTMAAAVEAIENKIGVGEGSGWLDSHGLEADCESRDALKCIPCQYCIPCIGSQDDEDCDKCSECESCLEWSSEAAACYVELSASVDCTSDDAKECRKCDDCVQCIGNDDPACDACKPCEPCMFFASCLVNEWIPTIGTTENGKIDCHAPGKDPEVKSAFDECESCKACIPCLGEDKPECEECKDCSVCLPVMQCYAPEEHAFLHKSVSVHAPKTLHADGTIRGSHTPKAAKTKKTTRASPSSLTYAKDATPAFNHVKDPHQTNHAIMHDKPAPVQEVKKADKHAKTHSVKTVRRAA